MSKSDFLKLDNQICFSLYRLSKLITQGYKEYLEELELTYPQYLVMMVLWEFGKINMTNLGEKLSLDNGTLTPLIKRLIDKNFVEKKRCSEDERIVYIELAKDGQKLKNKALIIDEKLSCAKDFDMNEMIKLKKKLDELYEKISANSCHNKGVKNESK